MRSFFAALSFLTIIPIPEKFSADTRTLGNSLPWFGVIGLFIGLLAALADGLIFSFFPPLLRAAFCMIFFVKISKGLHMDGLADTADSFFSSKPREQILEIMRDSRIGAMGAVSVTAVMIIKTAAVFSLPGNMVCPALVLAPVAGRCAMIMNMSFFEYARKEGGLASVFAEKAHWKHGVMALVFVVLTGLACGRLAGMAAAVFSVVYVFFFAYYTKWKIGGFTGDTLGASCELTEMFVMIMLVLFSSLPV